MSHLHKGRLAQINESVEDLKKERTPEQTAEALDKATADTSAATQAANVPKAKRSRKAKK